MSRLSNFIRFASADEKSTVYGRVIRAANREQNAATEPATDAGQLTTRLTRTPPPAGLDREEEPATEPATFDELVDALELSEEDRIELATWIEWHASHAEEAGMDVKLAYVEADDELEEIMVEHDAQATVASIVEELFEGDVPTNLKSIMEEDANEIQQRMRAKLSELVGIESELAAEEPDEDGYVARQLAINASALDPEEPGEPDENEDEKPKPFRELLSKSSVRRRANNAVWHLDGRPESWAQDAAALIRTEILGETLDSDGIPR